ncbi:MAG: glycosyltransferase family 4 protein, partial [Pirellulales bacterium]
PVAAVLADWRWPPNRIALRWLLEEWPAVRGRIPSAELLLAGRGLEGMTSSDGVKVLGFVGRSSDVLAQAAAVAFPAPATSGPKVKILEALACGLPVVTTTAGVEGLVLPGGAGAVVAGRGRFAGELASLLTDPERRRSMALQGRDAVLAAHAPRPAARARTAVIDQAFSEPVGKT